jgi:hypothetical protein
MTCQKLCKVSARVAIFVLSIAALATLCISGRFMKHYNAFIFLTECFATGKRREHCYRT